jgi:hypothetical protein
MKSKSRKAKKGTAARINEFTRWGTWEQEVLSLVNNPERVQNMVAKRRAEMDDDQSQTDAVSSFLEAELRRLGHNPDSSLIFIPASVVHRWMELATHKHFSTNQASTVLDELGIPELSQKRTKKERGWLWRGTNAPKDQAAWKTLNGEMD